MKAVKTISSTIQRWWWYDNDLDDDDNDFDDHDDDHDVLKQLLGWWAEQVISSSAAFNAPTCSFKNFDDHDRPNLKDSNSTFFHFSFLFIFPNISQYGQHRFLTMLTNNWNRL